MNKGYVYCFSNESMPGILKIGMTSRSPLDRLRDANIGSSTWKPPTEYKIEFAKEVVEPYNTEQTLHSVLPNRINPNREFFKMTVDEARVYFDEMEGTYWTIPDDVKENDSEDDTESSSDSEGFKCKRCGNDFKQKKNLISHLKRKKTCETKLRDIDIDKYLVKLTSKEVTVKTVFCKYCNKQMSSMNALSTHKQRCKVKLQQDTQAMKERESMTELKMKLEQLQQEVEQLKEKKL